PGGVAATHNPPLQRRPRRRNFLQRSHVSYVGCRCVSKLRRWRATPPDGKYHRDGVPTEWQGPIAIPRPRVSLLSCSRFPRRPRFLVWSNDLIDERDVLLRPDFLDSRRRF